jgi:hypothetical protein
VCVAAETLELSGSGVGLKQKTTKSSTVHIKLPWHSLESGSPHTVLNNNKNGNEWRNKGEREEETQGHTEFLLHGFERWWRDNAYYANCA